MHAHNTGAESALFAGNVGDWRRWDLASWSRNTGEPCGVPWPPSVAAAAAGCGPSGQADVGAGRQMMFLHRKQKARRGALPGVCGEPLGPADERGCRHGLSAAGRCGPRCGAAGVEADVSDV